MKNFSMPQLDRLSTPNLISHKNNTINSVQIDKGSKLLSQKINQAQLQKLTKNTKNSELQSNPVYEIKNFIKKDQASQFYAKQFTLLSKSSFLVNNRLTKSVFEIRDVATFGKGPSMNMLHKIQNLESDRTISSLKIAAKNLKNIKTNKFTQKKSYIPKIYQKSLSLGSFKQINNDFGNKSIDKDRSSFFPTTSLQQTQAYVKQSFDKLSKVKNLPTQIMSKKAKLQRVYKQKIFETSQLATPKSQIKIKKIDLKIYQLKRHNESMHKLIPIPIIKPQRVIAKGKGQMISQDKIIRMIDKLLAVIELYFQMNSQNGVRVFSFIKNIQGFDNKKISQILCQGEAIKHIKSGDEIKNYFWIFRLQNAKKEENFALPQFFGQQDYALYKILNNFSLKLESKYENHHKQKYKKFRQIAVKKERKIFNNLYFKDEKHRQPTNKKQNFTQSAKGKTIMLISSNEDVDNKAFLQKIRYNPIKNDKNLFDEIEGLEDLGVKFDFKQKGRSIILSQRSKIVDSER